MVYCVVPGDLRKRLHAAFERHFQDDPGVTVVVERRTGDRRRRGERRLARVDAALTELATTEDRRRIRNTYGRRVDQRRAPHVAALEHPALPRAARRHANRIQFAVRIDWPERRRADAEAGRLITSHQSGDAEAFRQLYVTYFDEVYAYLRLALQTVHNVEGGLQAVFSRALVALQQFDVSREPFRVVLARLLYGHAPDGDDSVARAIDDGIAATSPEDAIRLLEWLTDEDLRLLMERLPPLEREVMALCYVLDLTATEIAAVAGIDVDEVERVHARSIRFMDRCLASLSQRPGYTGRHPIVAAPRPEIVMRRRRLALVRN